MSCENTLLLLTDDVLKTLDSNNLACTANVITGDLHPTSLSFVLFLVVNLNGSGMVTPPCPFFAITTEDDNLIPVLSFTAAISARLLEDVDIIKRAVLFPFITLRDVGDFLEAVAAGDLLLCLAAM